MIEYILQVDGQNMLQVHYLSGVNRYIFPDEYGNYLTGMSKAQLDFIRNSNRKVISNNWRNYNYWLNKELY